MQALPVQSVCAQELRMKELGAQKLRIERLSELNRRWEP